MITANQMTKMVLCKGVNHTNDPDTIREQLLRDLLLEQRMLKIVRVLGVAFCLIFLLGFCLTWQSNTLDDFSPTGYLKDLSSPDSIWLCLFSDVLTLLLVMVTTLVVFYRILSYSGD